MSIELVMPKLSDTMEEGKILRWLKRPGDQIHHGDALAEVETDKADMVMESFEDGVMQEIRLHEGESAKVGATIAIMSKAGEQPAPVKAAGSSPRAAAPEPVRSIERPARDDDADERSNGAGSEETPRAAAQAKEGESPRLRRLARKQARLAARPASPDADARSDDGAIEDAAAAAEQSGRVHTSSDIEVSDDDQRQFHPALAANPSAAPTSIPAPPARGAEPEEIDPSHAIEPHDASKFRASPLARRAAEEAGIDISSMRGSGPDGRITKRDVDNFLREQQLFRFRRLVAPKEGAPGTRQELSKMRRTIALRMAQSKREIPHFYVTVEVDMEEAVKLKSSLEVTEIFEEDITYNDIVVKACALALARYPRINASFKDDGITIHPTINIGVAVAVEDGLIVPVIHGCERLTLPEIARLAHRLVGKAARGGFTGEELSGATFTISNMGMLDIEHFSAVIVPPQAAILAVSSIKEKPVVRKGQIVVGRTMMVTVSCDHRIVDGVVAGRFLQELKRFLENPASLLV